MHTWQVLRDRSAYLEEALFHVITGIERLDGAAEAGKGTDRLDVVRYEVQLFEAILRTDIHTHAIMGERGLDVVLPQIAGDVCVQDLLVVGAIGGARRGQGGELGRRNASFLEDVVGHARRTIDADRVRRGAGGLQGVFHELIVEIPVVAVVKRRVVVGRI